MNLTVACVLRAGGDFNVDYVARLRDGVAEHLPDARFVCLSDQAVPCERIPLISTWPRWWAKIELFRIVGRVIYFDLDTMIVGSLAEIAAHPHRFTIGRAWFKRNTFASGFMAYDGDYSHIFKKFRLSAIPSYQSGDRWGDQGFIQDHVGCETEDAFALFPGQFVSYKYHCKPNVPSGARVVMFHGKPRPADIGWRINRAA